MKVLQILPRLNSGGVERGTVEVASYLVSQGHKSIVVSFGGWRQAYLDKIGVKHIKLPVHSKNPVVMISLIPRLARIIEENDIDVVHARSRVPAWISYYAVRMVNRMRFKRERYPKIVNFITTCHGLYSKGPITWVMGMGRRVIVPSEFIGEYMKREFDVPSYKIVLVPRGVDLDEFNYVPFQDEKDPIFLVIGRITPNKGQDIAIRAFAKIARKYPNSRLWIVGDVGNHRYYQYLRSLQIRFSLHDSVEFLGPRKDISDIIAKAYALLIPSQYPESFGRGVVESGAVGRPVIASNLPALNELVDGKNGLLAQADSIQDWQEKMIYLLENPDKAIEMGLKGRRIAEDYGIERMCESVLSTYESVLGGYRIGVVKTSSLGDIVLARYSFESIKKNFPNSEIIAVGPTETVMLWEADNYTRLWQLFRPARADLDIVYDLQGRGITQFLSWRSGAHRRFGCLRKLAWLFHTDPIRWEKDYPIQEQKRFLSQCGLKPIDVDRFYVEIAEEKRQEIFLKIQGNTLGSIRKEKMIGLVLRSNWPSKTLSKDALIDLITKVDGRENYLWVLIGTMRDRGLSEELVERVKEINPLISLSDMTGRTSSEELFPLIDLLDLLITPDSAPLHFAYLIHTPTIVYFGPTFPARHLPDAPEKIGFIKPVWTQVCHPCYKKICPRKTHDCLIGIVEEILKLVPNILSADSRGWQRAK